MAADTKIRTPAMAIALGIALVHGGLTAAAVPEGQVSTLRVGMPLVAETLDPARADNAMAVMLMAGIYDTLYARNPAFRALSWEDLLTPQSRAAQKAHPMRGKRLPRVDRIEFSSTPEDSAELLALRRGELDLIMVGSPELATQDGRLKPEFARAGLQLVRDPAPYSLMWFFSMRDPVVGGGTREKIALRRAIAMAFDDREWTRVLDAGFPTPRHQVIPPGIDRLHYRLPQSQPVRSRGGNCAA